MDIRRLQNMYQQWQQGNEHYVARWADFIEMAAQETKQSQDAIMRELQKTYWFHWGEK
jgi:hypothetical protein